MGCIVIMTTASIRRWLDSNLCENETLVVSAMFRKAAREGVARAGKSARELIYDGATSAAAAAAAATDDDMVINTKGRLLWISVRYILTERIDELKDAVSCLMSQCNVRDHDDDDDDRCASPTIAPATIARMLSALARQMLSDSAKKLDGRVMTLIALHSVLVETMCCSLYSQDSICDVTSAMETACCQEICKQRQQEAIQARRLSVVNLTLFGLTCAAMFACNYLQT